MCRGVKAECGSISTLNFIFSGSSICFGFSLINLSLSLSLSLSSPRRSVLSLPFPFAFHGGCLCRCDDWRCLSEAPSTVLSRITKIQECFTPEHLHLSKHVLAFFFLSRHLQQGPQKETHNGSGLKRGRKRDTKYGAPVHYFAIITFCRPRSHLPAKILRKWHELSFSYLLNVRLFHLRLQQLMDSIITAASDCC